MDAFVQGLLKVGLGISVHDNHVVDSVCLLLPDYSDENISILNMISNEPIVKDY